MPDIFLTPPRQRSDNAAIFQPRNPLNLLHFPTASEHRSNDRANFCRTFANRRKSLNLLRFCDDQGQAHREAKREKPRFGAVWSYVINNAAITQQIGGRP